MRGKNIDRNVDETIYTLLQASYYDNKKNNGKIYLTETPKIWDTEIVQFLTLFLKNCFGDKSYIFSGDYSKEVTWGF